MLMPTPVTIEDLCSRLRLLSPASIVGLEGFSGSGKTKLAEQLRVRVPAAVLHVDSFARRLDQPLPYIECLDIDGLRRCLEQRGQSRPTVVEGICLRDVLAHVGQTPAILIYLRRIGRNGLWYDGSHLEEFEARQEGTPEPHRSDLEYHARVRPHEHADLVYERVEIE